MKIKMLKNELVDKLALVSKAADTTNTVSNYSRCVLFEVKKETSEVLLTCCNYAMEVKAKISANIELEVGDKMEFLLEVDNFSKFVNKLPSNEVELNIKDGNCNIKSGRVRFSLGLFGDATTFPHCDAPNNATKVVLNGAIFADKCKKTLFAAANPKNNQMMGGMHLTIADKKVSMTCLDGHRVAINSFMLETAAPSKDCVIPVSSLKTILGNIGKAKELCILMDEKNVAFSFDDCVVYTRLIEGNFFPINKMIETKRPIIVSVNRLDLLESVSRAELVTQMNTTSKRPVIIEFAENVISISADNGPGNLKEDLDATCSNLGELKKIAFNPIFLREMLSAISTERINMELIGAKAPMYVTSEDFVYLTLPVNIK